MRTDNWKGGPCIEVPQELIIRPDLVGTVRTRARQLLLSTKHTATEDEFLNAEIAAVGSFLDMRLAGKANDMRTEGSGGLSLVATEQALGKIIPATNHSGLSVEQINSRMTVVPMARVRLDGAFFTVSNRSETVSVTDGRYNYSLPLRDVAMVLGDSQDARSPQGKTLVISPPYASLGIYPPKEALMRAVFGDKAA